MFRQGVKYAKPLTRLSVSKFVPYLGTFILHFEACWANILHCLGIVWLFVSIEPI